MSEATDRSLARIEKLLVRLVDAAEKEGVRVVLDPDNIYDVLVDLKGEDGIDIS